MCVNGKWTAELGCCKKLSSSAFCEPATPQLSSAVLYGSESVSSAAESISPGTESIPLRTERETTSGIVIVNTTTISKSTATLAEVEVTRSPTTVSDGTSKALSVASSEKAATLLPKLLKAGTRRGATTTAPSILAID
uniref:Uncharacterized protein n=1 Tax=Setaria digitata TaxID=48799 RepID=A0A915PUP4_9BILA